ncbi:MAG TPA: DUF6754 domain-containing protein [Acidobacteriota bacterium]|nr:DUF6754 domain-containing protein [Acidobacteriota bacterium]
MATRRHFFIGSVIAACLSWALLTGTPASYAQEPSDSTAVDTTTAPAPIPPAPPSNVQATDTPNDNGHAIGVVWDLSADDIRGRNNVLMYEVLRTPKMEGPFPVDEVPADDPSYRIFASNAYGEAGWRFTSGEWDTVGQVPSGATSLENRGGKIRDSRDFIPDYVDFQYRVIAVTAEGGRASSPTTPPVHSRGHLFHLDRILHIGFPAVLYTVLILGFIGAAQRGRKLYIRPLAGIDAVDEAIGRATEMNRPILYVLGLGAADEIATIASFSILSRVAKKVAEHRTELLVPCYDAVVMSVAQETVKQAYLDAGRPDDYNEDIVYFVTQDQFPYVAAVNGTMLRRQTATNFYLGVFYAESLILAETGSLAGSIQISGTDRVTQIPFFVVACDYTLIGEELYAASAYLGREPKLLGTLKAQDWFKVCLLAVLGLGVVGAAFNVDWILAIFRMSL